MRTERLLLRIMTLLFLLCGGYLDAAELDKKVCLEEAFNVIRSKVAEKKVTGAIGLVSKDGRVLGEEAKGHCDVLLKRPMTARTVCWIASLTKPVTATAGMLLVEDGK